MIIGSNKPNCISTKCEPVSAELGGLRRRKCFGSGDSPSNQLCKLSLGNQANKPSKDKTEQNQRQSLMLLRNFRFTTPESGLRVILGQLPLDLVRQLTSKCCSVWSLGPPSRSSSTVAFPPISFVAGHSGRSRPPARPAPPGSWARAPSGRWPSVPKGRSAAPTSSPLKCAG